MIRNLNYPLLLVMVFVFSGLAHGQQAGSFETSVLTESGEVQPIEISNETRAKALIDNHDAVASVEVIAIRDPAFDRPILESRLVEIEIRIISWHKMSSIESSTDSIMVLADTDSLVMPGENHSRLHERNMSTSTDHDPQIHRNSVPSSNLAILPSETYLIGLRAYNGKLRLPSNSESIYGGPEREQILAGLESLQL